MAEAHIPFSHCVASKEHYANGVGTAYMVGSLQECRLWVLAKGMRASTDIIPF